MKILSKDTRKRKRYHCQMIKYRTLKKVIYSKKFYIGLMLSFVILSGSVFIKRVVRADKIYIVSEKEFWENLESCKKNQGLLSEGEVSLMLNGSRLPYDKEENIWYVSQNRDKEVWEGIPELSDKKARLYWLDDGYMEKKAASIREGHLFWMAVVKGEEYALTHVIVSGMPVISIETESTWQPEYPIEDIDNYVFNSELRYLGDITIFNANGNSGTYEDPENSIGSAYRIVQSKVSYHTRGNTSDNFEKKSYSVKLTDENGKKKKENLFGLGESAKWKLLAAAGDVTKVREKTAWQLWEEIADRQKNVSESASAMEYCEVVLNGDYIGMYQIVKGLDEDTLKLQESDVLYKFLQAEMPLDEDIQNSIDAGYVVCYPIRIRYPKQGAGDLAQHWEPVRQYLGAAYEHIDFEKLYNLIDLENTMDYYLFLEATSAWDNACKNTYHIARETKEGEIRMLTIPWDLNYTFGDEYATELELGKTRFNPDTTQLYTEPVIRQLFMNNTHGEEDVLKEKWRDYRQDIFSDEHVLGLMQKNMEYMLSTGAFERDSVRWPMQNNDSDLRKIMEYEKGRLAFLDGYFGGV